MLIRSLLLVLATMLVAFPATAQTLEATPGTGAAVDDHVAWVLSLFDGGASDLTAEEVETRFDANFVNLVPPEEFIGNVQQLADILGPLELVEEQAAEENEHVAIYRAGSGDLVLIGLAVDPATGQIAGLFINLAEPASDATPAASLEATPAVTPSARGPVVEDADTQIALYERQVDIVRAVGEPAVEATLAGDDEMLREIAAPELAAQLESVSVADVIDAYTTRQVQMTFDEEGILFFGQWNGDTIDGLAVRGGVPLAFRLRADATQDGELPSGRWSGEIPQAGTELSVEFGVDDGGLTATLSMPMQGVEGAALTDVAYLPERPVGKMVDERAFAPGGRSDSYTADFAWGDHLLRIEIGVDVESGLVSAIQMIPAIPTPLLGEDPPAARAAYWLPFEGTWYVFWGGETVLRNYHAAVPSQRFAYDLVIWKDGATFTGDGTRNDDYWAWGQPVLAPADGVVVSAVNDAEDLPPGPPTGGARNPAGNHVVIQAAEGEYVFIAHMQQGSVRVGVGDEVRAGDLIGVVGNSGNTSEPHIHIHVQDTPQMLDAEATGIPLRFESTLVNGEPADDVLPVQGSFISPAD